MSNLLVSAQYVNYDVESLSDTEHKGIADSTVCVQIHKP